MEKYKQLHMEYGIADIYKAIIYDIITDAFLVDLETQVGDDVLDEYVQTIFYTWNDKNNIDVSVEQFSGQVLQVIECAEEGTDFTDVESIVYLAMQDLT